MAKTKQNKKEEPLKKGIGLDLDFRKFVVAAATISLFLVLPIYVIEKKEELFGGSSITASENPYSARSIAQRNGAGQVAGINTDQASAQTQTFTIPIINSEVNFQSDNNSIVYIIIGVTLITAAIFLGGYLFLGKFE
ncbi:MAG TPA: hypothetical protein VGA67_05185 [Candidatus Dojkabacteria bacterium]|jgi:hypothetical protein